MIIIMLVVASCTAITWATWKFTRESKRAADAKFAGTLTGILSSVLIIIAVSISYSSYLDIRAQYDAIVNQYRGAVTMYTEYASLDMGKAVFTDFKYQGYQENVAGIIKDLREEVIKYNEVLIKKKLMDRNPFLSWLIIGPDKDMKIINIVE